MENFRLKVFRVVARHLNFTRAAEELLLTQQIKALEDEYGLPLFDRVGGRITLTAAGAVLLPYAEQLKALSDEAFEAVTGTSGTHAGTLTLGASQTIGQYLLPNFVAAFLREHPRVAVTAVSGNTDAMLDAVAEHRVQLALIEGPGLRKDLRQAPLLMREFGSGSRRVIENALAKAGLKKKDLRTVMELDSTEGQVSAVEAGLGVTFVSQWSVRHQLALHTLGIALVKGFTLARKFSLAYPPGPEPRGNAEAFRCFILSHSHASEPTR